MKKFLYSSGLALLLIGCASVSTQFQTVAGKFLTSTAITVDVSMQAAAKLEVMGVLSTNDWSNISLYYVQYQSSMSVAQAAYNLAVSASDPSLFTTASNSLYNSKVQLTTKVTSVTSTK